MIQPVNFTYPRFERDFDFNMEELSSLDLAGRVAQRLNEVIALANTVDDKIKGKEDAINLTVNRKLSPTGDFTGTIASKSISKIFGDIADSLTLAKTLIAMVNNRESIGTIFDGGNFTDTVPATITIEGGLF